MKKIEIGQLLAAAKSLDPFIKGDNNQTNAWLAVLDSDMPFEFGRKIVVQHYRNTDQTIKPVIFIRAWQAERNLKNWDKAEGNPTNHVPATPQAVSKFVALAQSAMTASRTQKILVLSSKTNDSREDRNG
jgi:hypothetical protein